MKSGRDGPRLKRGPGVGRLLMRKRHSRRPSSGSKRLNPSLERNGTFQPVSYYLQPFCLAVLRIND